MTNANRESIIFQTLQGDRRLKRVTLTIRSKKNLDHLIDGYALVNELNERMLSFFSTSKFPIDDELIINFHLAGHPLEYHVSLSTLHEQISSGKIMKDLPMEGAPFPGRKFYRCFAKVVQAPVQEEIIPSTFSNLSLVADAPLASAEVPNETANGIPPADDIFKDVA